MCIRLYCHSRYMEYHVYQIWYKMCTFAEIKTLVTFICIPPLGKAPNSMINNTLTCSLPLHCHRYTILRISVSLKLISFLTESQASSPTSFWEAIWYNLAEKAKGPCFLSDFFLREAWPVRGQVSHQGNHHLCSLENTGVQSRQQGVPSQGPAATLKPGLLPHTSADLTAGC